VEAPRKHGPLDTRWPRARTQDSNGLRIASALSAAEAAEALEWDVFSRRYFPGRRRHDSEARSAYTAYRQGREWRTPPARLSLVPTEHVTAADEHEWEEAGTQRLMAAMAAARDDGAKRSLPEDEVATDGATRDVQRALRDLDGKIALMPRRDLGARVGAAFRRPQADR
jgi:hypothetical protein